jgi:23S rRNA pseudouridine2605 synthase
MKSPRKKDTKQRSFDIKEKQWPVVEPRKKIVLKAKTTDKLPDDADDMRLNKFIAHCGVAARRKSAELVKAGKIMVNGVVELNPSYMVLPNDLVSFEGKQLKAEANRVYLLMNKPKDVITSAEDERGRRTVLDIIKGAVPERMFPVGRLDRDTTGLLLLTNDGDLAQKMAHPSFKIQKVYHAELNEPLMDQDLEKIRKGVELEDGFTKVNWIRTVEGSGKKEVELEIVIGKNRVVRRIFEHLAYEVVKLDRIYYAGLTKKDLPRGRFRHLTQRELVMLKHFSGK